MAAGEEQQQPLVRHVGRRGGGRRLDVQQGKAGGVRAIPAEPVDCLAPGRGEQPGQGFRGYAVDRPACQGGCDRLGRHVLG
jgi:hypothetical protein